MFGRFFRRSPDIGLPLARSANVESLSVRTLRDALVLHKLTEVFPGEQRDP